MTYVYGKSSRSKLRTCHPDLQLIFNEAIKTYDITILEGARSTERQRQLYTKGASKCDGIISKSKHQVNDDGYAYAVDAVPYPIDWHDSNRFFFMAGLIFGIADRLYVSGEINHKLRWGHDWDMDKDFMDQTFNDSPHFELYKP
jgi:peptidoglycan L-alanyl-D-glutamate endopeptidase CwlK